MPEFEEQFQKPLKDAIAKCGGQEVIVARTGLAQGQISRLANGVQRSVRNLAKLDALLKVINDILSETPPADGGKFQLRVDSTDGSRDPKALANRARSARQIEEKSAKVEFRQDYPRSYGKDFARARKLSISGLNLRRILQGRMKDLKNVLERKGNIRVIFLDPDFEELCRYAAIQDWGESDPKSADAYSDSIRVAYRKMSKLQKERERKPRVGNGKNRKRKQVGTLQIKKIRYPLGFGIDAMTFDDPKDGDVRSYPMFSGEEDRPIVPLKPADGYWYTFYKNQFELHWRRATTWRCGEK